MKLNLMLHMKLNVIMPMNEPTIDSVDYKYSEFLPAAQQSIDRVHQGQPQLLVGLKQPVIHDGQLPSGAGST